MDEAETECVKATECDPDSAEAYSLLSGLLESQGRSREAQSYKQLADTITLMKQIEADIKRFKDVG
jgi:hypothetical protein